MNKSDKKQSLLTKTLNVIIKIKDAIFNGLDFIVKKLTNNFIIIKIKDNHLYLFSKIKNKDY